MTDAPRPAARALLPAAIAAGASVLASAAGLLCWPIGIYDDSLLLLGARLVRAGREPYRDFYTHYGPFAYTLLAPLQSGNPGPTLRLSQGAALALVTALLLVALRRTGARASALAAAGAVFVFSASVAQSSFVGIAFAACAVAVYAAGRALPGAPGLLAAVAGGALLAATAWTRPVFAAYAALALTWLELAGGNRESRRRFALLAGASAAWAIVLYAVFYSSIRPAAVIDATVLAPARLMTLGNRGLTPDFVDAGAVLSLLVGAAIAAAPLAWACTIPSRAARLIVAAAVLLGAVLPLGLGAAGAAWLTLLLTAISLAANAALAWVHRVPLRSSPRLWAAAAFGLAASGFGHYFWSRADPQHLYPLLAFAACSALLAWEGFPPVGRLAVATLFVLAFVRFKPWREPEPPVRALWNGGLAFVAENLRRPDASLLTIWPAALVRPEAANAVLLADSLSTPGSRFVAFGTNQNLSSGDPVYLFLLSRRLPYTHWFQYDPGLQSSPAVQDEMLRELASSGSSAAVVWRSEAFDFDPSRSTPPPSSRFDDAARRAYGRVVARFGNYEVRVREELAAVTRAPAP